MSTLESNVSENGQDGRRLYERGDLEPRSETSTSKVKRVWSLCVKEPRYAISAIRNATKDSAVRKKAVPFGALTMITGILDAYRRLAVC